VKVTIPPGEGNDTIIASGFFDEGNTGADFAQPVTIEVGDYVRTVTPVLNAKGTVYKFQDAQLKLVVVPNLLGSSRGRFRLRVFKTDLEGLVPLDSPADFHFRGPGYTVDGLVELDGGKYKLGTKQSTLIEPVFFASKAKATLGPGATDTLKFTGGFATNGQTPAAIGDVDFGFGDFRITMIASAFTKKGGVFTATQRDGPFQVTIKVDFVKELVTVTAKGIDLGPLDGPTTDIVFDAGIGNGDYTNTVVLGGEGSQRTY
jgi:hypothetical protein